MGSSKYFVTAYVDFSSISLWFLLSSLVNMNLLHLSDVGHKWK